MKEMFTLFMTAQAQGALGTIVTPRSNFNGPNGLNDLITAVSNWMITIVAALAVIAIVYAGFLYLTAGGDTAKTETGRKTLTWAIVGILIAASARVIVAIVINRINLH